MPAKTNSRLFVARISYAEIREGFIAILLDRLFDGGFGFSHSVGDCSQSLAVRHSSNPICGVDECFRLVIELYWPALATL